MNKMVSEKSDSIENKKELTPFQEFRKDFINNRSAMIGSSILLVFILLALFAPLLSPYTPYEQDSDALKIKPFQEGHILGTDDLGRDLFTRIIFGGRISLTIGLFSTSIA